MWKCHNFEIILTSNAVMSIQDPIVKWFGYRERAYSMGFNTYFGPILIIRPHATHNCGPRKSKFEIGYYRQTYGCT